MARILGVLPKDKGRLVGRVLEEAMSRGGAAPASVRETVVSEPGRDSLRTVLEIQRVGGLRQKVLGSACVEST
jgi:hypothetical protein